VTTTLSRDPRRLAVLAMVALIIAGCSNGSAENGNTGNSNSGGNESAATTANGNSSGTQNATDRGKEAMRFAKCMRDNGVSEFPDPDASGELTIDGIVNGSSLDTSTPAWREALSACKDLQPPGFTGHRRSAEQQKAALKFAQCMRDNGIKDFPDPTPDAPLIDTTRIPSAAGRGALSIPGFKAAQETCGDSARDAMGGR
jgi:hypothetical protein